MFWIPRDLVDMPAFTTNIEFGYWMAKAPEKVIIGSPDGAPKMAYIIYQAKQHNIKHFDQLDKLILNTMNTLY